MLSSIDGKINSGSSDNLDVDRDWKNISGIKEGLQQYYDIEKTTDLWSLNTGRTLAKIGYNELRNSTVKSEVSFVVVDSKPHLTQNAIEYLSAWLNNVVIVTTNNAHPAISMQDVRDNVHVLKYDSIKFSTVLSDLYEKFGCTSLTIQSGSELNGSLFKEHLIDNIYLVMAPVIVGGRETPGIVGGNSLTSNTDLDKELSVCTLKECRVLSNNYLTLRYTVNKPSRKIQSIR
jgi:2,5-diamino-6-(ribosylamino)-4(3H)-pyrimidinone 5'-phosphate reductase